MSIIPSAVSHDAAPLRMPAPRRATVLTATDVSPTYRRLRFACPDLAGVDSSDAFTVELVFPGRTEGGRPLGRTFYLRTFDPATGEFEVEFVLHGSGGVASEWARRAAPGSELGLLGPRGGTLVPRLARCVVLAGDATAAPAIAATLETLPADVVVHALIEVPTAADALPVRTSCAAHVTWLHPSLGDLPLAQALASLPAYDVDHWWAAAEAGVAERIRQHVLGARGVPEERVTVVSNWKHGEAFGNERQDPADR